MTPRTVQQNLLYWAAAIFGAILLSFLSSITIHWPEDNSIDWRAVTLDVIQTVITILPVVGAGLGLPRLGKEGVAALVSEVGTEHAKAALEVEASRQETGLPGGLTTEDRRALMIDVANEMDRRLARQRALEATLEN